jgi:hypothetical protein
LFTHTDESQAPLSKLPVGSDLFFENQIESYNVEAKNGTIYVRYSTREKKDEATFANQAFEFEFDMQEKL